MAARREVGRCMVVLVGCLVVFGGVWSLVFWGVCGCRQPCVIARRVGVEIQDKQIDSEAKGAAVNAGWWCCCMEDERG